MSNIVSVIIPVYNRDRSVDIAIRSVIEQQYRDIEIIVVDDGSMPPLELSNDLMSDSRIKLVRLDKNKGPSAARNAGVRASSGEWLAWLDSDDIWYPQKLSLQMSFLDKLGAKRNMMALATGFEYAHSSGLRDRRIPVSSADPLFFFAGCWFCPGSTVMIHRSLFDKIGPYDETMRRLEDVDWFIRLVLAGGCLDVVPQIMATISLGQKPRYLTVKCAGDDILVKYKNLSQDQERSKSAMNNLMSYLHLEYAASAFKRERCFIKGTYHLAASLLRHPRTHLPIYPFWNDSNN